MVIINYINSLLELPKLQNILTHLILSGFITLLSQSVISGDAHIKESKVQEWIDKSKNIKIQFAYSPEKPIIDTFTELKFSVQDLETGEHINNFDARVVVTNGQRLFKFENITVADGDFSVKYIFPDDGTHQVVTRISKETSVLTLATFNVFVPHQSPPSILNPFSPASSAVGSNDDTGVLISRIVVVILLPIAITVVLVFMLRRGRPSKRKRRESI